MSAAEPALLMAEALGVTYSTRRGPVEALAGVDMSMRRGELVSVLGPSGCGKSTLLKVGAGLLRPSRGRMVLEGTPITAPRREVGVVFQQPTLLPWQNVLDNVMLPIRTLGLDVVQGRARAMEMLRLVGLEGFAANYPGELSGGMQQRVGIARGMVHEPRVLFMDEPFAALDAMTREHMMIELQRIRRATQQTIFFITHSIPEAVFLSDRIIVLSARPGRVLEDVAVELPPERNLDTMAEPGFVRLCNHLRALFQSIVQKG